MTLTAQQQADAIRIAADTIHANWQASYREQNGADAVRFKPLKDADIEWLSTAPASAERNAALRTVEGKQEINILAIPNSLLTPSHAAENTASATSVIARITANPTATDAHIASLVHDDWVARNGSWAAEELKKPYDQLSVAEQNKDLAVVKAGKDAIAQVTSQELASGGQSSLNHTTQQGLSGTTQDPTQVGGA